MRRPTALCIGVIACLGCGDTAPIAPAPPRAAPVDTTVGPPAPRIDGAIDEWSEADRIAMDASGDTADAFDITALYATSRGTSLYVRLDVARELNLYNGDPRDGNLWLSVGVADIGRIVIDLRGRAVYLESQPSEPLGFNDVDLQVAPGHAATSFELGLDLARWGVHQADRVAIEVFGSDELDEPATWFLSDGPAEPLRRSNARVSGTSFRVASLNTELAGLADPRRADIMARLVRAADADVYCFQELGHTSAGFVALRLHDALGSDGWQVHRVGFDQIVGMAIASRSPIVPIDDGGERWAAAIVELPEPGPVAVFSVHLKCCGYLGSPEDVQRLSEARAIIATIERLRAGELGEDFLPYRAAPIVVVGDFNHVGSREVVEGFLRPGSLELTRWLVPHLNGNEMFTWSDISSPYPPSLLDVLLYRGITPRRGFLLDSRELEADQLDVLQLRREDSDVSDHLMLVADFE